MLRRLRLSPAMVVAMLSLLVSLGGVSYAATKIGTSQIKNGAVTTPKLHKNAVATGKIQNAAVTADKIAGGAVTADKIAGGAVTADKIAGGAVTADKIAGGAVTTDKIAGGAVTADKIAAGVIPTTPVVLFATVAPASAAAVIVRGSGATAVSRIGVGYYAVTFNRSVAGCTWLATYGQPDNTGVDALWATIRGGSDSTQVRVVLRDATGAQADGDGFHVGVLCP